MEKRIPTILLTILLFNFAFGLPEKNNSSKKNKRSSFKPIKPKLKTVATLKNIYEQKITQSKKITPRKNRVNVIFEIIDKKYIKITKKLLCKRINGNSQHQIARLLKKSLTKLFKEEKLQKYFDKLTQKEERRLIKMLLVRFKRISDPNSSL